MKEVKIKGKTYIRTAAAAKLFGYSQDYLGQLSREGRIAAKRVGRSWFVDPDSVADYQRELETEAGATEKEVKQTKKQQSEKKVTLQSDNQTHHVLIHTEDTSRGSADTSTPTTFKERLQQKGKPAKNKISAISDKQSSSFHKNTEIAEIKSKDEATSDSEKEKNNNKNIHISARKDALPKWQQVSYEPDATELHPQVKRTDYPPISNKKDQREGRDEASEPQPTRTLRVHNTSDMYSIVPSKIPSVRLRGRVPVKGEDEVQELPSLTKTREKIAALSDVAAVSSDILGNEVTDGADTKIFNEDVPNPRSSGDSSKKTSASPSNRSTQSILRKSGARPWILTLVVSLGVLLVSYLALSIGLIVTIDTTTGTSSTSWYFNPFSLLEIANLWM